MSDASSVRALADELDRADFIDLFHRLDDAALRRLLEAGPDRMRELAAIAEDDASSPRAAFLAAEILFRRAGYAPREATARRVADRYAAALRDNVTQMGNPWGIPGLEDGEVGDHVVALGTPAIASFAPLLGNDTPVAYAGSREATYGQRQAFRVKDLAAWLIARIQGVPFPGDADPPRRDRVIESLRRTTERGGQHG